ncbi:MAG TPA: SMI1/KNR4 family protein [Kamptonema sp.]|nr:SMI1/KNR4 family protein [Kamptonema sp.]
MNLDQVCTHLEIKSIWNRIDKWLAANAPEIMNKLQTAATDEAIAQAEKLLEIELPEDVKASYRIHNGQDREKPGIFEGWNFLSLQEVIKAWESWKNLLDEGVFNEEDGNNGCASDGLIRTDMWWNPKWIPITAELGGDNYCLDLDPAPGGQFGQIIIMYHDDAYRELVANNFREWLAQLAADLEGKKYQIDKNFYWLEKVNE